MALTMTLAQLRSEVGLAIDVPVGDAYLPNATVDLWINLAIQEYQALRAQYGLVDSKRTTLTSTSSTTPGTDGFPANEILSLPADFSALESLLYVSGIERRQLQPLAESDRQTWWTNTTTNQGPPEYYALVDATPNLPARARVWPPMQAAYTFEIIYRPQFVYLVGVNDTWEFLPGTEDLVVCKVAIKQATREGVPEPNQFSALQQRYQAALAALQRMASRSGGVTAMRDTRGRSRIRGWLW